MIASRERYGTCGTRLESGAGTGSVAGVDAHQHLHELWIAPPRSKSRDINQVVRNRVKWPLTVRGSTASFAKAGSSKYIRMTDPCPEQSRISHCYITAQHRLETAKPTRLPDRTAVRATRLEGPPWRTGHGASCMKGIVSNQQPGNRRVPVPWFPRGSSRTSPRCQPVSCVRLSGLQQCASRHAYRRGSGAART